VWNVHGGQCLHELREHTHVVETVAFAPDSAGRTLAAVESGSPSSSSSSSLLSSASLSLSSSARAGRFLASGSRDKTVKLWNATVGQCLMTFV
ncbi:unnamed protein product, partial [Laminaria digitata]